MINKNDRNSQSESHKTCKTIPIPDRAYVLNQQKRFNSMQNPMVFENARRSLGFDPIY